MRPLITLAIVLIDAVAAASTFAQGLPTTPDPPAPSGRGYIQGRFRGERMAYGELEYRWTVKRNGLLGIVAFLNTETLSNEDTGERLFDAFATGGGVGLRLMMNKHSKTNLAFDVVEATTGRPASASGFRKLLSSIQRSSSSRPPNGDVSCCVCVACFRQLSLALRCWSAPSSYHRPRSPSTWGAIFTATSA